jgi:SpoVK/Ycf46/Vps4 family AAA+-type ATPase
MIRCIFITLFLCLLNLFLEFSQIDSVMSARQANEHDASRRLKSEFLIQFDGVTSDQDALVIVIGLYF